MHKSEGSGHYISVFWFSFALVLAMNALVWLYLNQVEERFSKVLQDRMRDINNLTNRFIKANAADIDVSLLTPGETGTLEYLFYEQVFDELRKSSDLQSVLLAGPQGEILVASPSILVSQISTPSVNNPLFKNALKGIYSVSQIESYAGQAFVAAYSPIENIDGFIVGVLIIEARASYFTVIDNLRNRLFFFSAISIFTILLIAFLLYRSIGKSVQYQQAIREHEHLVQLGTMAATVAHELRNPLNIIDATNDVIRKKYAGKSNDEIFGYIPSEVKRLSSLIERFLKFARVPQLTIEKLDWYNLEKRIKLSLSDNEVDRLDLNFPNPDKEFYADSGNLEQILINIILNAFQAMDDNGRVLLHSDYGRRDELHISVFNEGTGIPDEIMANIFTPFYSTKDKGTGLGLPITKRLIEQFGGSINIRSEPGKGTTVVIIIPNQKGKLKK